MSVSKQLGWDSRASTHAEYAGHYSELARLISSERALVRLNDSTFARAGGLIKKVQTESHRGRRPAHPGVYREEVGHAGPPKSGALSG
jgi:hypothetical protein